MLPTISKLTSVESMSPSSNTDKNNMGLKGIWATIANLTAVALVCLLFYQSQQEMYKQNREERQMFRDELRAFHEDSNRQWEAQKSLTRSVEKLSHLLIPKDKEN
jgi:hypothetical protein